MSAIWKSANWTRQFGILQTGNLQFGMLPFVYHECTMRRHAEMGDVLTGKLLKKNVEYTNKILFHLYQDSADCQFSRKKTGIYGFMTHTP
jgi:hypothetical protein